MTTKKPPQPQEGEEEVDNKSVKSVESEWGDRTILSFMWPAHNANGKKEFNVKWSGNLKETKEPAMRVLKDMPEEALRVIWKDHHNNIQMREWINKAGGRSFRKSWVDIETYALKHNWPPATPIPIAAALPTPKQTKTQTQSTPESPFDDIQKETIINMPPQEILPSNSPVSDIATTSTHTP